MVQPWTGKFSPLQPFSNVELAWIKLPRLIRHMYKRKILGEISNMVGRFTKLEFNIDSTTMGPIARIVVYVNLDKPLVSQVLINGKTQRAEGNETVADSMVTDVEKAETLGMFGPCMQVKRKSWQSLRDFRNQKPKNLGKVTLGSRFLTLTMLDEIEEGNGAESADQLEGSEVKKGSSMEKNPGLLESLLSNSMCSSLTSVPSHHLEFFDSAAGTTSHFNPIFEDLEKHSVVSFKENVNTNDVNSIGKNFGKLGFIGRSSSAKSDAGRNGRKLNRIIHECGGLFKLVESHRAPLSDTMNSIV
ncbi:hypothetical protein Goshw_030290 [Gossypium schwendimanii]|uniref:DUF4283 domain-containing protein n=1 Tax=Gossypium schwendimanii TaxID=34291 RepID=A0A7J9LIZ1_GOSSC|nr:hypothetical protein [Gossypium schwendimanii]